MTTLLAAHDLHARYGDSHVLRGVTVQVPAGRSLGLLGRNGMGKTTLIRTVLGYVRAAGGSVAWQGRALTGAPPEKMARLGIGYVPEGRGIFPNLSVRENLVMTARAGPSGERDVDARARARDLPAPRRAARPRRPAALGRRAADALDRPRPAHQSAPADPRRGDRRPGAAGRRRDLAHRRRDPRHRHRHADRRPQRARRPRPHRRRGGARERPRRPRRRIAAPGATTARRWQRYLGV